VLTQSIGVKRQLTCRVAISLAAAGAACSCVGVSDDGDGALGRDELPVTCPSPRSFGAIPNDGIDDRAALQAALDSGCSPIVLEAGVYNVHTPPPPRTLAILTMRGATEIVGAGDATLIVFSGDAGQRDWHGIALGNHAIIHRLKLDTANLVNTEQQTHAIQGTGPLTGPLVENVTFNHPIRGLPGGDCIQLVGRADGLITNPIIRNNNFAACDRSSIGMHSGVHGGQISNNSFPDTGDQDIDGEGTGDLDGVEIGPGNSFAVGPHAHSSLALHLDGARNMHIHDNTFNGRGLLLFNCSQCEVDHDTITQVMPGSTALQIEKDSAGVQVHDEHIRRAASAGAGSALRVVPHGSGTPRTVAVTSSQIIQETAGSVVEAFGIVGLQFVDNVFTYSGPADQLFLIHAAGSSDIRSTKIVIMGNTFDGAAKAAAVHLSGSGSGIGTASLRDNTSAGATRGLLCDNINQGGKILGPIIYSGNSMPPPACQPLVP
jgi:hypothetical protein